MKFASMLSAAAFAGAVAPPRISLDLVGTNAYQLDSPTFREHDQGLTQNDGTKVMSRQDWTEKCSAKRYCSEAGTCASSDSANWVYTGPANCPFPVAKAYDHQDGEVEQVVTRVFIVDLEGAPQTDELLNFDPATSIQWTKRSTYLFKYDASDSAGNHAEQVVFALILNDDEAPTFQEACADGSTFLGAVSVEASSEWSLCQSTAYDNVDDLIDESNVEYKVEYLDESRDDQEFFATTHNTCGSFQSYVGEHSKSNQEFSDYATAAAYMSTDFVGRYLVTVQTSDTAGMYGQNSQNNAQSRQQAILIKDSAAPSISLAGSDPATVECRKGEEGNAYTPTPDSCSDSLDSESLGYQLPVTTTYTDTATNSAATCATSCPSKDTPELKPCAGIVAELAKIGTHEISYTCSDFAGNTAETKTRTVNTVDILKPTIALVAETTKTHLVGESDTVTYHADNECKFDAEGKHIEDTGISKIFASKADQIYAEDSCDASISSDSVEMSWGDREFNCRVIGDYIRTYSVSDASANSETRTRTFSVIDIDQPTIAVIGSDEVLEASRDTEYTDQGATCSDLVDAELSHAVEVSGMVVNMRVPGTYTIAYDCEDLSGNTAVQQTRDVIVEDTTDPELTLVGAKINYVEAGFAYVDSGATATDTLDGDITDTIWKDGDTVSTSNAFYSARSCQQIYNMDKTVLTGPYEITAEVDGEFKKIGVNCIFYNGKGYTYHIHTSGAPGTCTELGLVSALSGEIFDEVMAYLFVHYPVEASFIGNQNDYICTVDESATELQQLQSAATNVAATDTGAQSGRYVIQYGVSDAAANAAIAIFRTVIVKDTLPPVITLTLNQKLIHKSASDQKGIGGEDNTAADHISFMAESTTSVNGWVVGAVASAVAGVALLGFSRRQAAVTSVPV